MYKICIKGVYLNPKPKQLFYEKVNCIKNRTN